MTETRNQNKVIGDFRVNNLNLLVTTSVLEEGLDIPQCNLVVRLDPPKLYREYVQSMGRARSADSFYIIFCSSPSSMSATVSLFESQHEAIKSFAN